MGDRVKSPVELHCGTVLGDLFSSLRASYRGGSGGMSPGNFKNKTLKLCFLCFWNPRINFLGKAGVHANSL